MRHLRGLLVVAGIVVVVGAVSWPATGPVNRACGRLQNLWGGSLSVERARWVPWGGLRLTDVRMKTRSGGLLHAVAVRITPGWGAGLPGRLTTRWVLEDVRIDPASWGIHQPLLQELLSAGPVADRAEALLGWNSRRLTIVRLALEGRFLRLNAHGWLAEGVETHLDLDGALSRRLLEQIRWVRPIDSIVPVELWEPFRLRLRGPPAHPEVSFSMASMTGEFKP